MSYSIPGVEITLLSSGDMSTHQYTAVSASTTNSVDGSVLVAVRGAKMTGVYQHNSTAQMMLQQATRQMATAAPPRASTGYGWGDGAGSFYGGGGWGGEGVNAGDLGGTDRGYVGATSSQVA